MPGPSLSSSARLLGSMAKVIAGSGNFTRGYRIGAALSPSVSPVSVSFNFATAPISPACNSVTGTAVFPCMIEICDSFSADPREKFCAVTSFFSTPEKTLKYEILPENASDTVLNTYIDTGSASVSCRLGASPLPEPPGPPQCCPAPTQTPREKVCPHGSHCAAQESSLLPESSPSQRTPPSACRHL